MGDKILKIKAVIFEGLTNIDGDIVSYRWS